MILMISKKHLYNALARKPKEIMECCGRAV